VTTRKKPQWLWNVLACHPGCHEVALAPLEAAPGRASGGSPLPSWPFEILQIFDEFLTILDLVDSDETELKQY